ncbi:MAG: cache domain-containing protein [Candidatus Hodarchaeales archaeon]
MKSYYGVTRFLEDSEDWKAIMSGLLVAIIIISSACVGIFLLSSQQTMILEETPLRQVEDLLHNQAIESAESLDVFFSRIEGITKVVGDYATQLWEKNDSTGRPVYYHNSTFNAPTDFAYSAKHSQGVSYTFSGYKVAPSAYNNQSDYLTLADDQTYGDWSPEVNHTINLSADMDFVFQPMYQSMDDILWIYMGTEVGVHRSYPYHGPYSKDYDPRIRLWYLTALDTATGNVAFTTPYVDASSGKVIVTSLYPVRDQSETTIGVVGIDFKLTTIQSAVVGTNVQKTGRAFLINRDFEVLAHPDHTLPNATWRETDLQVSITTLETNNADFLDLLDQARNYQIVQEIINYGGSQGDQIVSLVPMNKTDLILGLALTQPSTITPTSKIFENIFFLGLIALDILLAVIVVASYTQYRRLADEM